MMTCTYSGRSEFPGVRIFMEFGIAFGGPGAGQNLNPLFQDPK